MADSPPQGPVDVRLLGSQELPRGDFPGGRGEVFRVYFSSAVHDALWKHAAEDTSVEICGVLVGTWERDANGPFVRITESIRGDAAENKFAEVTFTHATWSTINGRMDAEFSHLSIVGWYHTHPDFGVFLSDRDRFIHEHFFSGAGQIAHVIDPIRKSEGVFVWKEGKPSLTDYFWVGDRIVHTAPAGAMAAEPAPGEPAAVTAQRSGLPRTSQLLAYLALFLLGYTTSGCRSAWEDQMLKEGAVYHFGIWKGLRPGLREELDMVSRDLEIITQALRERDVKSGEPILDGLNGVRKHIAAIRTVYGFTDTDQEAVRQFLAQAERVMGRRPETADKDAKTEGLPENAGSVKDTETQPPKASR